jgi:phosphoglucosamine mutase
VRRYFGTDGVRGIVGEELTPELVERLGRAAALWSGGGRVFIGRDTRASGPMLEEAFAEGVASVGGNAVLGGVLPTPAVALLALDLGTVVSASHNPPEYNGIKFFDGDGQKLTDAAEEELEALLDEPSEARSIASASPPTATSGTSSTGSVRPSTALRSPSTAPTAPTRASRRPRSSAWAPR